MGLSSWVESDGAADCRYVLQSLERKPDSKKLRRFLKKELNDNANQYNTDGVTNVALVMEDEGNKGTDDDLLESGEPPDITPVVSKMLTKREFKYVVDCLKIYVKYWKKKEKTNDHISRGWSQTNFLESYQRMLAHCQEKFNKRFKK